MTIVERCILRSGVSTWLQETDGVCHSLGSMTNDEAIARSIRERIPIRRIHPQSQGAFARDVARERFGLKRGHNSLWFVACMSVPIWARF